MGGIKNRKGASINRDWLLRSDPNQKAVRLMVMDKGKKRMVWAVKDGESYRHVSRSELTKG